MNSRQLDEEAIFQIARNLSDPNLRSTYLEQVCAGDAPLRERVKALLEVHDGDVGFLKPSGDPPRTAEPPVIREAPGQQIGRYKLLQQIGEGGFGVVYMAEQERPINRKVALKIIKPGMDTHAVVARFEAERQALALMDHPNIARVFDGGATESGRPYFVMELVKGVPITEYCDKNQLPAEERLKLFITVCQAVHHAHQKGVIHRDLKPSNILVTLHDGVPVIKVIDFGVAKAVSQRLTEKTLFTSYGQMIGTPQYMSPEQAEMSGLDVDTRSDIYSLGVLLYELLTGTTPLEADRLRTAGYAEMQRMIREEEPPKPSTRLSSSGDRLTVVAKHRSVSPDRLSALVKGDLDWIALKALDKDRSRRYDSAAGFAQDIQRHLDNEPVIARASSFSYRAQKFARKYRTSIAIATTLALVLLMGIVSSSALALWAIQERDHARTSAELAQAALTNWRGELLDRAFSTALTGDLPEVERIVGRSPEGECDEPLVDAIKGIACTFGGDNERAQAFLGRALDKNPNSLAALCAASMVGLSDSSLEEMLLLSERIGPLAQAEETTDHERLMFAQFRLYSTLDVPRLITDLDGILSRHPKWGVAFAIRASAKAQLGQTTLSAAALGDALRDSEVARRYLPDNPFILGMCIEVYCYAIELARFQGKDIGELKTQANEIAAELDKWPRHRQSRTIRMFYHFIVGEQEKYQSEYHEVAQAELGYALSQSQLARMLQHDDASRLREIAEKNPLMTAPSVVVAIRHAIDGCPDAALDIIARLERGPVPINARLWMVDALCIAERPDLVKEFAERLLKKLPKSDPPSTWRLEVWDAEYLAGDIDEAEFLRRAGPFHQEQSVAHWAIGMMALAHGDIAKSREHLKIAAQCAYPGWWSTEFAQAYLNLMDRGRLPVSKSINSNTQDK